MFKSIAIVAVTLWGIQVAKAQSDYPAQQSIAWFAMEEHRGARLKALQLCRNDYRYYENRETRPVCENAEAAQSRIDFKVKSQGLNAIDTVEWWRDNRDLRAAALQACYRRAPYDQHLLQYCDVVKRAEKESATRIRG